MEEKERYELFGEYIIKDNDDYAKCQLLDTYKTYVILNQQDKRIKELEEENNFLEKRNEELMIDRRDICLERNDIFEENQQLKQQLHYLPKKIVENTKLKREKLYLELLLTRLQWIHKEADKCREEKERFGGIEDMALDSVWRVFDLQQHECCNYEEMCELDDGIKCIAEDKLLRDIEHDLQFKASRSADEIFEEIAKLDTILKKFGGKDE